LDLEGENQDDDAQEGYLEGILQYYRDDKENTEGYQLHEEDVLKVWDT